MELNMDKNKTLVLGASLKPERYAYMAAQRLVQHGHPIRLIGQQKGLLAGEPIEQEQKPFADIDTVTLYLAPANQVQYYDYILSLKPRRVVFNPGTENATFSARLQAAGVEAIEACTLVMLSIGKY